MNTFRKKSLYAALAGVSALGVTGTAQVVAANPKGVSPVLMHRGSAEIIDRTLFSIVNSTRSHKPCVVVATAGMQVGAVGLVLDPFEVRTVEVPPGVTSITVLPVVDKNNTSIQQSTLR